MYQMRDTPWQRLGSPGGRGWALAIKRMGDRGSTGKSYLQSLPGIKGFLGPTYLAFGSILIASKKSKKICRSLWV